MSAPFSLTLEASARLADGLTVLISIRILSALNPARNPSGPSATVFKASVFVTMDKVTSAAAETARGVSPHFIPWSTSHCAFERVRLYPVTVWPLSRSLFTICPPITPSPMNPKFAMRSVLPDRRWVFLKRGIWYARRVAGIFAHLPEMSLHRFTRPSCITAFHGSKNSLMVNLPARRTAIDIKSSQALFTQHFDDRIDQGENERIARRFGQGQMKVQISLNVGVGILPGIVHHCDRLSHRCQILLVCACGRQGSNLGLQNFANLRQM